MLPCLGAWAEVAPLKVSTDAQKYYYVIKNFRSHKFAYYNGDNGQLLQQTNPISTTAQENLNKYLWYVTEASGEGAYMLHNVATNKVYAAYNSFTEAGEVVYIKENPYKAGYVCVSSNADAKTTNSCWDDQGSQTKIGPYETRQNDNEGTSWEFIEIEDREATVAYTLTDNAGNSFNGTFTGWSREMYPVVTGVAGYTLSNIVYEDNNVTATVNFPFPVSKVDGTTNWTFIRSLRMSEGTAYLYVDTSNNKIVTKSDIASNGTLGYLPTAIEGEVQKWMWAIYPTLTDSKFTFQIKNAATGMFVPSATTQTKPPYVNKTAGNFSWGTCIGNGKGFYLDGTTLFLGVNSSSSGEQDAIIWNKSGSSHQGCNLEFTAPVYTANCTLNDNSGNIYNTYLTTFNYTLDENDTERPSLTGVPTSLLTNDKWENGAYSATINLPFAVTNGEKISPTFICTYGNDTFKWKAIGTGIKTVKNVSATSANIAEHLWEIIPHFDNGAFKFQIKNLATGTYINSTSNGDTHVEGKVSLSKTASDVTFESNGFKLSTGKFLSIGSSSGNTGAEQVLGTWSSHNGTTLCFPIANYTVEVGSTGYASLYTPIAGKFGDGVETYAVTEKGIKDGYVSLTPKDGVAANQGAIVEAAPGTYTFTASEVSSDDWSNNLLTGSSVNTLVNESAYVLGLVDGTAALALAAMNMTEAGEKVNEGGTHFLNNAGKAYLPATAVSTTAQTLRFNFGGTTGIEDAIVAPSFDANAPIFDLSGRRVMNTVKGGIYIQNGKKFFVK